MKHRMSPFTSSYYIWNESSAVFYSSSLTPLHSHNTMQLVLDIQNNFRFRLENGHWNNYKNLIIRENVLHQIDTNKSVQLIIYLNPESPVSKAIKLSFPPGKDIYEPDLNIYHMINSGELEKAIVHPEPISMKKLVNNLLSGLCQKKEFENLDKRVSMVERIISNQDPRLISIKMLAEKACLSESRLRALFKKATGTTIHQYILNNKIRFAANQLMAGNSISDAAFEGGFVDSSHFHKMMVKMFGITPSDFLQNNKQKKYLICDSNRLNFKTKVRD
jgi:AraC family transcriptional regulator